MNLHKLKVLSERAGPYLPKLGDSREQFRAKTGENYHGLAGLNSPHPLAGTLMVGEVSGYYEPEWDEETAWGALYGLVHLHFTDWAEAVRKGIDFVPRRTRKLDTPDEIFAAADDMVREATQEQSND